MSLLVFRFLLFIKFFLQLNYICSADKDVVIESLAVCPGNEKNRYPFKNMRYMKVNQTHSAWSFQINLTEDIDENIWFGGSLERWTHGRWATIPLLGWQRDPCRNSQKFFPQPWIVFATALNVKHPEKCPLPKGNYTVKDFLMASIKTNFPMWNGRSRLKAIWAGNENSKDVFMCISVNLNVKETI